MFPHCPADLHPAALKAVDGEPGVLREVVGHRAEVRMGGTGEGLAREPPGVVRQGFSQGPGVRRVEGVRLLHAEVGERAADRLEKRLAVLLDERLEEAHAEHLAFALVDARGEIFVDVVAEGVAVQEGAAAFGLHIKLDRRFLLRLAAEDLGDDALHLASIALIEQPRAPGDERVATRNQGGQPAESAADKLAGLDGRAVGLAKPGPREHVRHHPPHRPGGRGAEGHSTEVEAVVGDRQAVALRRFQQVGGGNAEVLEQKAVVIRMLERVEAVLDDLEVFVLVVGKVGDQDGRLVVDQADEADRPAGDGVGDEQFLAVDHVVVAVERRAGGQGRQIGAGGGLGQGKAGEPFAAGKPGQVRRLLFGAAKRPQRIDRANAAVNRGEPGDRGIDRRHLR